MLQLVTCNLNNYAEKYGPWENRRLLLAEELRQIKPDIVALQDARPGREKDAGADQVRQLAALLSPHCKACFFPVYGQAGVLSGGGFIYAGEASFSTHPLPTHDGAEDPTPRQVIHGVFQMDGRELHVFNAHLSWVKPQNQRAGEALISITSPFRESAALLLGDFNVTPDGDTIQQIQRAGWIDAWAYLSPRDPGFTFEAGEPAIRIDYIFAAQQLADRLVGIRTIGADISGPVRLSDHFPLALSLK